MSTTCTVYRQKKDFHVEWTHDHTAVVTMLIGHSCNILLCIAPANSQPHLSDNQHESGAGLPLLLHPQAVWQQHCCFRCWQTADTCTHTWAVFIGILHLSRSFFSHSKFCSSQNNSTLGIREHNSHINPRRMKPKNDKKITRHLTQATASLSLPIRDRYSKLHIISFYSQNFSHRCVQCRFSAALAPPGFCLLLLCASPSDSVTTNNIHMQKCHAYVKVQVLYVKLVLSANHIYNFKQHNSYTAGL